MMGRFAERENTVIQGSNHITCLDSAWKLKKFGICAILDQICNLIKEEDKNEFYALYWALKTYGNVAMDFKDLSGALEIFRQLKHEC